MDKKLFLTIFQLAQKNKALGQLSVGIAKASSKIFFIVYAASGLYLVINRDDHIAVFIAIPLLLLVVNLVLRKLCRRPRPYTALGLQPLLKEKNEFSFPSNHAASSCVIALACLYVNTALGVFMVGLAFITGLSRVLTGMHYPRDVAAGWLLAFILQGLAFYLLFQ